jgi:hypothetical protein
VAVRLGRRRALPQHGAIARIAPARPATPHSTNKQLFFPFLLCSVRDFYKNLEQTGGWQSGRQAVRSQNCTFGIGEKYAESPCNVATFLVNSEPHTEARPSVRLCDGLINRVEPHTDFQRTPQSEMKTFRLGLPPREPVASICRRTSRPLVTCGVHTA